MDHHYHIIDFLHLRMQQTGDYIQNSLEIHLVLINQLLLGLVERKQSSGCLYIQKKFRNTYNFDQSFIY